MDKKEKKILSISILISNNRAETIEKCMKSLVPLREAVPSELIIVDTGCMDEGIDIARKYADKVVEFTWCNDFAAARNAGLAECTGEWFLYMDDDEWFEDVSELIDFFCSEERNRYDALWYVVRNYDNFAGTVYTDTFAGRVVKLTPKSRFYGKIHEWLEPLPTKMKKVSSYAHHYGYVYKNEEERQKHLLRNISLEEAAVAERPNDIRMCCQLVQEYRAANRFDDAEVLCKKVLKETEHEVTNSFVQYLLVTLPKIYREQNEFEKSLTEFERLEKEERLLHQTKRTLYYEKVILLGQMKEEERMQEECRRYFEEYETLPQAGEPAEYEIMDFAHYTSDASVRKMLELAYVGMMRSKTYHNAEFFFDRVDWTQENPYPYEALTTLLEIYRESGDFKLLLRYLPKILEQDELATRLYGSLHNMYATYPDFRTQLLEDFETTGLRSGNLAYFHLLYLEQKGKLSVADVEEYYEKSDRKYDDEVLVLLLCKKELLSIALRYMSLERYQEAVAMLLKEIDAHNMETTYDSFLACEENYPEEKRSFFLYGRMALADKALRLYTVAMQEEDVVETTEVRGRLEAFAEAAVAYCEYLYHPTVLAGEELFALPQICRFAYRVKRALETENNISVWSANIKEAAKLCPEFLPLLRILSTEKEQQKVASSDAKNAAEEMLQLAETLKEMVRKQIEEGQLEEAKVLLVELSELLPEDQEVVDLLNEIKGVRKC